MGSYLKRKFDLFEKAGASPTGARGSRRTADPADVFESMLLSAPIDCHGGTVESRRSGGEVGVWVWDLPSRTFNLDSALVRIFALSPRNHDIGWRHLVRAVHPEDRQIAMRRFRSLSSGNSDRVEFSCRLKSGGEIPQTVRIKGEVVARTADGPWQAIGSVTAFAPHSSVADEGDAPQHYAQVFNQLDDAIVVADAQRRIVDLNPAAEKMFGFSRDQAIGQSSGILTGGEPLTIQSEISESLTRHGLWRGYLPYVRADGKPGIRAIVLLPLRDRIGEANGVFGVTRDITAWHEADAALVESESRFRNLVELSNDGILVHTVQGIQFANAAAARLLGVDHPDQLIGRNLIDWLPEEDVGEFLERRRQILHFGRLAPQVEKKHVLPDGRVIPIESTAKPIVWNETRAVLSVIRDISERKHAEQALRESERRYRQLVEASPDPVRIHTFDEIVFANRAAADLFGADSPEDLLGRRATDLLHQEDVPDMLENRRLCMAGYGPFRTFRRIKRLDGQIVETDAHGIGMMWHGRPSYLVINRDISHIKRVERNLLEAKEESDKTNAAKSRFLAAASHDLRQPLQALSLLMFALSESALDPDVNSIAKDMRHALDAMESVINGLLDISKLEAGVILAEPRDFSIADMFARLRAEFAVIVEDSGASFRIVDAATVVETDPDLLYRILQNYLSNAVRYCNSGRVLLGCRRNGDRLRIEVWDNGPGIPDEHIDVIFEEFYQLENSARDRNRGLGLGLTIVRHISRLLGVETGVRSWFGRGSVFSVTVPLGNSKKTASAPPLRLGTRGGDLSGSFILLIEDDLTVQNATRRLFQSWGANVTCCDSVANAIALLTPENFGPDLIVADYRLADEQNGIELFERIRTLLGRTVPGLIVTGDTAANILRAADEADIPVLHKPVNPGKLRALACHLLLRARTVH